MQNICFIFVSRNDCLGFCMDRLYLFNSESDLALADFTEHYMAPALIRQMSVDLAMLPMWYALPGSGVLAGSAYNLEFMQQMKSLFGMQVNLITWSELKGGTCWDVLPWGWNPALKKRLIKAGISADVLPTEQDLAISRSLASRELALAVLDSCRHLPQVCGSGCALFSIEDCKSYWMQQYGRCVFKAPWSGSGKGLLWCYSDFSDAVAGWCGRILAGQGVLVGMPIYNKVCDFAMEFHCHGKGTMDFIGYSWFDTNSKGAYQANWLASDKRIRQRLLGYVDELQLLAIEKQMQEVLGELYGIHQGYLGVDMMVCQLPDGQYAICPCVEVNVRMNMGLVARIFTDRYLYPGSEGYYKVEAFNTSQALRKAHEADEVAHPREIIGGKLLEGYLPLVPVTPQSRYRVYVKVCSSKKTQEKE